MMNLSGYEIDIEKLRIIEPNMNKVEVGDIICSSSIPHIDNLYKVEKILPNRRLEIREVRNDRMLGDFNPDIFNGIVARARVTNWKKRILNG